VVSRRTPPPPASFVRWTLDDHASETDKGEALLRSIDFEDPGLDPEVRRLGAVIRSRIEGRRRQVRVMRDALDAYEKTTEKGKET
jgi:hypothetical protein